MYTASLSGGVSLGTSGNISKLLKASQSFWIKYEYDYSMIHKFWHLLTDLYFSVLFTLCCLWILPFPQVVPTSNKALSSSSCSATAELSPPASLSPQVTREPSAQSAAKAPPAVEWICWTLTNWSWTSRLSPPVQWLLKGLVCSNIDVPVRYVLWCCMLLWCYDRLCNIAPGASKRNDKKCLFQCTLVGIAPGHHRRISSKGCKSTSFSGLNLNYIKQLILTQSLRPWTCHPITHDRYII